MDGTAISRRVLWVLGPLLIATGVLGFVLPPSLALMSGAAAYNWFHIAFGLVGTAIVASGRARATAIFNLGFGAFDLWQAAAGPTHLWPSALFDLRIADHIVHVLFGAVLVLVGARGLPSADVRRTGEEPAVSPPPGAEQAGEGDAPRLRGRGD